MPYLITGATGPVGVEAVQGDFTKEDLPERAFEGVKRVFLFPAQGGVEAFLQQAKTARVEQLVVLSSRSVEQERYKTSLIALHHLAIEKAVMASGIPYTFLRPGSFANNLLALWAPSIQTGGIVSGPYANSIQVYIHEADIAEVFQKEMEQSMPLPLPVIKSLLDYWSDTLTVPEVVLPTVEQLTGHKGRTLQQWAKDHASDFSPSSTN